MNTAYLPENILEEMNFLDDPLVKSRILKYTSDTWNSIKLMIDPNTGFVQDRVLFMSSESPIRTTYTSPTNIGLFVSCLVAAHDLAFIDEEEFKSNISKLLSTLTGLERYDGLYYNWYSTTNGALTAQQPFISTVDNAWLVAGLATLKNSHPEYEEEVTEILSKVNLLFLYDSIQHLFYGGFYPQEKLFTTWHYGLLNTEARIITYISMYLHGLPDEHRVRLSGYSSVTKVPIFPSWGGSMFEVFMPGIFISEYQNEAWKQIHRYHLQKQIEAGSENEGFWGFSPCDNPEGIYTEFGVPHLAVKPGGYGVGSIVTPHAIFLALSCLPEEALRNLFRLEDLYPKSYEEGLGFVDSINTKTGSVAASRLILDQAMSFLSLYNFQTDSKLHTYLNFSVPSLCNVD